MIGKHTIRNLLEGVQGDTGRFERKIKHLMGLADAAGHAYRDEAGNACLRSPRDAGGREVQRMKPAELSLRGLAEALLGEDFDKELRKIPMALAMRDLLEDNAAGAVMASQFANINAFTAATSGLLEVAILEQWQAPEFIADDLAPPEPTRQFEGRKSIGVARLGDVAEERLPGMPTKRVQLGERWITQPRTVENSLACEVTQEAVYLDLTGEVTEEAGNVGMWLGYRKELRVIDSFLGVTNTYNYKGNSYNTYLAASTWDNDFSNELLHIDDVQETLVKFRDMKDPETNTRVLIQPSKVLVNMEKSIYAEAIFGQLGGGFQYRDAPGSTSNPQLINQMKDSPYKGKYTVLQSPLVYERCVAADGLNLSASNAAKYWWMWDPKFMRYAQNWPLRTQTAAPNQVDMIDRGVVLYVKADERGVPMTKEPRRVVRNKN